MALAMLPMAVVAADGDYTVAGSEGLCGANWDPSKNPMTDNGDGTYSITFADVAAGTYEFKVTDGTWSNSWGQNGGNYQITLTSTCDVTIHFNADTTAITVEAAGINEPVYYLRGSMNGWGADDASKMVKQDDGTYAITLSMAAGDYEYKAATADWSWSLPGGDNATLSLAEAADVTFVLDVTAGTLTNDAPEFVEYEYFVAGDEGLCGVHWDPASNQMTLMETDPDVWAVVFWVTEPGTYEYKVTTGSWETPSYGTADGGNCSVVVKNPSSVIIEFNVETEEITCEVEEWGFAELKFQLNADASADDETVDLRMISYVESLEFYSVWFEITINGETATAYCDSVYEAINVSEYVLTSDDIFGYEGYLVTYTLTDIPAEYFDADIDVTAYFVPFDAEPWCTNTRTIVLSDILD